MYKIQKIPEGFKLTFSGFMTADEVTKWFNDSKRALTTAPQSFGIFVDMRTLNPLPTDAQAILQEGQKLYKTKGMKRSVVILAGAIQTMQFRRIAKETGIDKWERYIDASKSAGWEKKGLAWISKGVEPGR